MGKRQHGKTGKYGASKRSKGLSSLQVIFGKGAILLSCHKGKERNCAQECVNMLDQVVEKYFESKEEIIDDFEAELKALRDSKGGSSNFTTFAGDKITGMAVIQLKRDIDVIEIVKKAFDMVKTSKMAYTRYVVRMIPLQSICFSSEECFMDLANAFLPPVLKLLPEDQSYAIAFKSRSSQTLPRETCIPIIGNIVNQEKPSFKVDLKHSDWTIMSQVLDRFVGISLISTKELESYHQFNMKSLLDDLEIGKEQKE